jgi:hypothetical protein
MGSGGFAVPDGPLNRPIAWVTCLQAAVGLCHFLGRAAPVWVKFMVVSVSERVFCPHIFLVIIRSSIVGTFSSQTSKGEVFLCI